MKKINLSKQINSNNPKANNLNMFFLAIAILVSVFGVYTLSNGLFNPLTNPLTSNAVLEQTGSSVISPINLFLAILIMIFVVCNVVLFRSKNK